MNVSRLAVVAILVVILAAGSLAAWNLSRGPPSSTGPSNGTGLSALVEMRQANQSVGLKQNATNVSVNAVNGTVPVSSVTILIVPGDNAITPTASWSLQLFANSSSKVAVCSYYINSTVTFETNCTAGFATGMVFSAVTPGVSIVGGYLFFHSTLSLTNEIAWIH